MFTVPQWFLENRDLRVNKVVSRYLDKLGEQFSESYSDAFSDTTLGYPAPALYLCGLTKEDRRTRITVIILSDVLYLIVEHPLKSWQIKELARGLHIATQMRVVGQCRLDGCAIGATGSAGSRNSVARAHPQFLLHWIAPAF
jgi:hypothetical protein